MRTLSKLILSVAVILSVGSTVLFAQAKPNFSGIWALNPAKSDLGGAQVSKVVVQVEHNDPGLKYTARGVENGREFEETESLTTDGKPGQDSRGAIVKTYWKGATLVSEAIGADSKPLYETRLTLSDDGKSFTRDFIRKSADDPQWRHEIYEKR